jgi:NhaA family Na+:H+ antiporter
MRKNQQEISERFFAPFEQAFDRIRTPFEEFVHQTTTAGLLLMMMAILALIIANSLVSLAYVHLLHTPVGFHFGDWVLEKTLHHWINDGLMTLFFFAVGLELKRELLVGELADPRQALLPIIAAIGGMLVPALLYAGVTAGTEGANGWGIPMATDIAFALGVIALLAGRVPKALIAFLVALAIVDDLGAVVVIAIFYTEQLSTHLLMIALGLTLLLVVINRLGVRSYLPYFIIATLLWLALLESGVHATLAGVITAFTIPAIPRYNSRLFSQKVEEWLKSFNEHHNAKGNVLESQRQFALLQSLEAKVKGVGTPLQQLEHRLHFPVAFLVLPVFAFANAGVILVFDDLWQTLSHPVTLGVMLGLVVGKLVGIAGTSWLVVKLGWAKLPDQVTFQQIIGVGLLGGIGFTMAIFIAEIGFSGNELLILQAKIGILLASVLSGVIGYLFLRMQAPHQQTD